jgi:quercetin dioxygenase-like cupin family protein
LELSRVPTDWRQRGFSCALWTDPPGRGWADFVHPVDERLLPVEGEIELTVQGRTWRPALGEEVFIPAGVAHTVRNVGGTTSRWWYGYRTRPSPDRESPP